MRDFFQVDRPIYEASAPGRLDVMGGVADYGGSLLLQMPIAERTTVQLQLTEEDFFTVVSDVDGGRKSALVSVDEVSGWKNEDSSAISPKAVNHWTRYILGCILLATERFAIPLKGARIYVRSELPMNVGLSSSAALEIATMRVLAKAYELKFKDHELSKLAHQVENLIVGSPSGLMDQLTVHHGKVGELLPIICQPAKVHASIKIPSDIVFERIDSGVSNLESNEAYETARAAAFMGYGILAEQLGASKEQLHFAKESGDWTALPAQGYLANLDAAQFEQNIEESLPGTMLGADFIKAGHVNIDLATQIDPQQNYPIRAAASHPVYENACIHQFASLLAQVDQVDLPRHQIFARLGLLMLSSHASYSAIGLGHESTDEIVHKVVAKGAKRGCYGARVTGGGCGGTVVVLKKA